MYRLESVSGYDSLITQHYVAETDADTTDIPVVYYGYFKSADNKFYDDVAFETGASAVTGLYKDITTGVYYTRANDGVCTALTAEPCILEYAVFGSTVIIVGTGTGVTTKMLDSKGNWVEI